MTSAGLPFSFRLSGRSQVVQPQEEALFQDAIRAAQPDVCIFDRFIAEEAFSFRVRQYAPKALRVLDMQDLHFWRRSRQELHRIGKSIQEVYDHIPELTEDCLRELAAVYRSDLSLVCSPKELDLLKEEYQIPAAKLQLASFFVGPSSLQAGPGFHERSHFMTIGNFRHPPNLDSVQWLKSEIWPKLRKRVPPGTELHVYGAYGNSHGVQAMSDKAAGFHIKGHMPHLDALRRYRVMLAPLRFGAGLKGKIVDGWIHGLPCVTTPIGSEGLHSGSGEGWGGTGNCQTADELVAAAKQLYSNEAQYSTLQQNGLDTVRELFNAEANTSAVMAAIESKLACLQTNRTGDVFQNILFAQGLRATEYFSRWIELKESIASM